MVYFNYNDFERAADISLLGNNIKALVIGDIILDKYTYGQIDRTSTGVAVPTIDIQRREYCLGGAANVAANLKSFVEEVSLIGPIGVDGDSDKLKLLLSQYKIGTEHLLPSNRATLLKERIYVADQQLYRLDQCKKHDISITEFDPLRNLNWEHYNLIVIADYDYGACSEAVCQYVIEHANGLGIPVIVSSRNDTWKKFRGADYYVVNRAEFLKLAGSIPIPCSGNLREMGQQAVEELSAKGLLITMGAEGLLYIENDQLVEDKMSGVYPVNVTGAGDTVLAVFASNCLNHKNIDAFANVMNIAGRTAVLHEETLVLTRERLLSESYLYHRSRHFLNKIIHRQYGTALVESWKRQGLTIVFTNGCFDLLHPGHIHLLREAKKQGDRLVVGLNSDASIRRIKGDNRPIHSQRERSEILACLEMIDCLIIFDEDTAVGLIDEIRPDVYVKGDEYKHLPLPEAPFAKRAVFVKKLENLSTTNTIQRIIEKNGDNME
ncbi:PfkB family carbohydrate kinase [Neobacillus sp. Marseille-QA0830]